jgi:hypothetical protein
MEEEQPPPGWDFTATILLLLAIALLVLLTFELWAPHPGAHR